MKPVTHKLIPFTLDRVPIIRANRERVLLEGRESLGKGQKRAKRSTTGTSKPRAARKTRVVLSSEAQQQLESLDPAVRDFLRKAMK